MNASPTRNACTPCSRISATSSGAQDAAFGDQQPVVRYLLAQRQGRLQIHREGVQVAVVDAEQARAQAQRALQFLGVVDLHQDVESGLQRARFQLGHRAVFKRGSDQQDAVGSDRSRLEYLPFVDDEILAQDRQVALRPRLRQIVVVALEEPAVGQHRQAGRATRLVGACDGCRIEVRPDHALAGAGLLDLRNHCRAGSASVSAAPPCGEARLRIRGTAPPPGAARPCASSRRAARARVPPGSPGA